MSLLVGTALPKWADRNLKAGSSQEPSRGGKVLFLASIRAVSKGMQGLCRFASDSHLGSTKVCRTGDGIHASQP